MTALHTLMLVSAPADQRLRDQVRDGQRPSPEYLGLEAVGVELLDWSRVQPRLTRRTWMGSTRHALAALPRLDSVDVVFSDGEQVGVPLSLGMMARRIKTPHLMLGHRLTTRHKRPFFTALKCHRAISRIAVHSTRQLSVVPGLLGIPAEKLSLLPYHADEAFWLPDGSAEERLVVSAGREQRDYATLVAACTPDGIRAHIADGSVHSPNAHHRGPGRWPAHVTAGFATYLQLRELYAKASIVAVPLIENDFQAGVTTILEAMAMAKPLVVTATSGQTDVIVDGVTGLMVPPGDPQRLRTAIRSLLDNPAERRRLSRNARDAFDARHTLKGYVAAVMRNIEQVANDDRVAPAIGPQRQIAT